MVEHLLVRAGLGVFRKRSGLISTIRGKDVNPCPAEPRYTLPLQTLSSEEANWSRSTLFVIQYVNLYQQTGSSYLIAENWKRARYLYWFSNTRVNYLLGPAVLSGFCCFLSFKKMAIDALASEDEKTFSCKFLTLFTFVCTIAEVLCDYCRSKSRLPV